MRVQVSERCAGRAIHSCFSRPSRLIRFPCASAFFQLPAAIFALCCHGAASQLSSSSWIPPVGHSQVPSHFASNPARIRLSASVNETPSRWL